MTSSGAPARSIAGAHAAEFPGEQITCTRFCQTFSMAALSLNDDRKRRVTGRRHREEGVANKSNNVEKKKKNSAIVRVCQLRMIVWLVDPPLVSSAGCPRSGLRS